MNSIDRILDTINFKKTDRVPVIPQVFAHSAVLSNVSIENYLKSGDLLAKCQINALNYYEYDAVFALFDTNVETEAAGSKLQYNTGEYAIIDQYVVNENTDISQLKIPNPKTDGRMPEILKAIKILRNEVGNDKLVVGFSLGPFTIASQLMGLEKMLFLAIDEPEIFCKLLNYATDIAITFSKAQIQAGTHTTLMFEPAAASDVVPKSFYREIILPKLKEVFKALKNTGMIANWLHTAGNINPVMSFYNELGLDIASFDYCMSPGLVIDHWKNFCACGNIRPLSFLEGTPQNISTASIQILEHFNKRGGFILSSGCEIPPYSKKENIMAMVNAAKTAENNK